MKRPIPLSTATLLVPNLINHSRLRRGFPVVLFALGLALFALPQSAKAADGAVGDGTSTAEGTGALRSLSSGIYDTAMGFQALYSNLQHGHRCYCAPRQQHWLREHGYRY